jgi:hypothetical protein
VNKKAAGPRAPKPERRVYVVYDARAKRDVDAAAVLFSGASLAEAQEMCRQFWPDCVIISYRLVAGAAGDVATDPRRE